MEGGRERRVPPSLVALLASSPDIASGNIREWHFLFQGWVSMPSIPPAESAGAGGAAPAPHSR